MERDKTRPLPQHPGADDRELVPINDGDEEGGRMAMTTKTFRG